ncbi:hypothetical protein PGT21_028705 [Puccinia graminis f. sp. tritici]|uniref:Uncharacterized protein n=1 Tax=Puccinia graminis f. sp. tritici TaxID=56615 RepID=A0A5B0QJM5_PUCGR|nr:hypothetical protein PGT21_028705 [Puccinia graminis f. sp. tritici]
MILGQLPGLETELEEEDNHQEPDIWVTLAEDKQLDHIDLMVQMSNKTGIIQRAWEFNWNVLMA